MYFAALSPPHPHPPAQLSPEMRGCCSCSLGLLGSVVLELCVVRGSSAPGKRSRHHFFRSGGELSLRPRDPSEVFWLERGTSHYLAGCLSTERSWPPAEAKNRRAEVRNPSALLPGLPSSAATSVRTIYGKLLIIRAPTCIFCKIARDMVTTD